MKPTFLRAAHFALCLLAAAVAMIISAPPINAGAQIVGALVIFAMGFTAASYEATQSRERSRKPDHHFDTTTVVTADLPPNAEQIVLTIKDAQQRGVLR